MAKWGLKDQTRVVESFDKPVSNPYKMFLINKNADIRGTGVTPGEKIVKSATLRTKRGEDPVMALFAEMVTYGNETGWKWIPKGSPTPEVLLDGTANGGECAAFAKALAMLATAPSKHGLGLELLGDISVLQPYKGLHNKGFVSANNTGRVTMIDASFIGNVFSPEGNVTDMTLWDDHKVVSYQGMLFDPSYGQIYHASDTLVLYHITERDVKIDGATYCRATSRDGLRTVLFQEDGEQMRVIGGVPTSVATKWRGPLPNKD